MILVPSGLTEDFTCFWEGLESSFLSLSMQADKIFPGTSVADEDEPLQKIDMDRSYPNQVDFLRFEVRD